MKKLFLFLLFSAISAFGQVALRGTNLTVSQATAVNPTAPAGTLIHVTGPDATNTLITVDAIGAANAVLTLRRAGGTSSSLSPTLNGTPLGYITGRGYGTTGYAANGTGSFYYVATQDFTDTKMGTKIVFETTLNDSISRAIAVEIGQDKSLTTFGSLIVNQATAVNPTVSAGTTAHFTATDAGTGNIIFDNFNAGASYSGRRANGTSASPTAVVDGNGLAILAGFGYAATGYFGSAAQVRIEAASTWTDTNTPTRITFTTTPVGSITQALAVSIGPDKSLTIQGDLSFPKTSAVATSNLVKTADTTLADVPGMSITVDTGKTYIFDADILFTTTTTGGFRTVMDGTAVLSACRVQNDIVHGPAGGTAAISSSTIGGIGGGNNIASTGTNATGHSHMHGAFTVTTGGTIKITAAQNNAAGATTFFALSTMEAIVR